MYYCYRVVITTATALHTAHHCCYPVHSCPTHCCPTRCCPTCCCPVRRRRRCTGPHATATALARTLLPLRWPICRRCHHHHYWPLCRCCCHAPPPLATHLVSWSATIHRRLPSSVNHPLPTVMGESSS